MIKIVSKIYANLRGDLGALKGTQLLIKITKVQINGIIGGIDELVRIARGGGNVRPVKYQNETSYTFQGGNNYRETVFVLDEPIGNQRSYANLGHYEGLKIIYFMFDMIQE